ncbi:autophagy-type protein 22 [Coprinopsis cinerea okayama7|uniref:Autophagy-related protein n=1 Tax=Coprinopsis cinerea (strain Okayama-7 / 130 / ATCC MYA-4618 / FGSC 9003) TaxID=240176 RepID=A8P2F2_COPC7|nr:autophagy-type protein 22 [Coprinopsis cinerea okayama7\|eukprot:XP_001838306.2 autophagy-type protein 22 [Coprinopsis cinerea okayama7\
MSETESSGSTATKSRFKRHLWGWLSYAFASEVFVIVSLTLFLPICLEQFARDNGVLLPDKTQPCVSLPSSNNTVPATLIGTPESRCVVKLGWVWVDTASYSLYTNSISVALQALTVISMGGIADHRSISSILFLFLPSSSPLWPLSSLLAILANVGFGASVVAMNSFLPGLGREEPKVVALREELERTRSSIPTLNHHSTPSDECEDPSSPLLSPTEASSSITALEKEYDTLLSSTTSHISSLGIAYGYFAGIVLLGVALIPVKMMGGSTWSLRVAIGLSGAWWAVGSIPAWLLLPKESESDAKPSDGSAAYTALPTVDGGETNVTRKEEEWRIGREIVRSWKRLGTMLSVAEMRRLKNTFVYLGAWFLLSDGIAGSLLWPMLQRRLNWSNLRILKVLILFASLIPLYGCLGFFFENQSPSETSLPKLKFGGLTTPGEMYILAVVFGSVYGAFQGYARSFYAELIPPGEEARWFGLFSITDKSSSFLGPLIVGLIADTTGNIRYAFFFLVIIIWSAIPVISGVDVEKGRRDAREYSSSRRAEEGH